MKKTRLFRMLCAFALAAAGALCLVNSKKAIKTDAETNSVTLAGSFNSWNTYADPLTLDGDYWVIEKVLEADDTFKIVVNGSDWVGDGDGVTWCAGMGSEGKGQNFKVLNTGKYRIKAVKTIGDYGDKSYGIVFEKITYAAGRYIVGINDFWSIYDAQLMNHSGQYSATVYLSYEDEIKIPYWNGSDFQWINCSYSDLTPNAEVYYCFAQGSDGNIKCMAGGEYTFYYAADNENYDSIYHISVAHVGDINAEQLAAKIMSFGEYSGHCGDADRFPAMKTLLLGLSLSEKAAFQSFENYPDGDQFKNAYDRYVAWAAALGQDPWAEGPASGGRLAIVENNETTNTITIIVLISLVSVTAIGGFFFIRKRKEN